MYYLALINYYFRFAIMILLKIMLAITGTFIMLLNMFVRLDWLVDIYADVKRDINKIATLKPVGPTFKKAVKFWRKHLESYSKSNNFERSAMARKMLQKHLANKPSNYVGFKYLRAATYSHDRLLKRHKNDLDISSILWECFLYSRKSFLCSEEKQSFRRSCK